MRRTVVTWWTVIKRDLDFWLLIDSFRVTDLKCIYKVSKRKQEYISFLYICIYCMYCIYCIYSFYIVNSFIMYIYEMLFETNIYVYKFR